MNYSEDLLYRIKRAQERFENSEESAVASEGIIQSYEAYEIVALPVTRTFHTLLPVKGAKIDHVNAFTRLYIIPKFILYDMVSLRAGELENYKPITIYDIRGIFPPLKEESSDPQELSLSSLRMIANAQLKQFARSLGENGNENIQITQDFPVVWQKGTSGAHNAAVEIATILNNEFFTPYLNGLPKITGKDRAEFLDEFKARLLPALLNDSRYGGGIRGRTAQNTRDILRRFIKNEVRELFHFMEKREVLLPRALIEDMKEDFLDDKRENKRHVRERDPQKTGEIIRNAALTQTPSAKAALATIRKALPMVDENTLQSLSESELKEIGLSFIKDVLGTTGILTGPQRHFVGCILALARSTMGREYYKQPPKNNAPQQEEKNGIITKDKEDILRSWGIVSADGDVFTYDPDLVLSQAGFPILTRLQRQRGREHLETELQTISKTLYNVTELIRINKGAENIITKTEDRILQFKRIFIVDGKEIAENQTPPKNARVYHQIIGLKKYLLYPYELPMKGISYIEISTLPGQLLFKNLTYNMAGKLNESVSMILAKIHDKLESSKISMEAGKNVYSDCVFEGDFSLLTLPEARKQEQTINNLQWIKKALATAEVTFEWNYKKRTFKASCPPPQLVDGHVEPFSRVLTIKRAIQKINPKILPQRSTRKNNNTNK